MILLLELNLNKNTLNNISNFKLLKEVWTIVDIKKKLIFFLILSLISALTDAVNIGLLIPFIKVIESPEILNNYYIYVVLSDLFSITTNARVFILLSFIFFLLINVFFRIYLSWLTLKISYSLSEELASKIYSQVLSRSFLEHIKENTSKTISDVTFRVNATTKVLMSFIILFNNLILSSLLFSTLLYIDFNAMGFVILTTGVIYISLTFLLKSRFSRNSKIMSLNQTSLIKTLQEGLEGFKEVVLTSTQSFFIKNFNKSYAKLNTSLVFNSFFAQSPKLVIETLTIILLLGFFYYSFTIQGKSFIELSGMIGVLVFGAQKLLPSFQAIYNSWSNITSNKYIVTEIIKSLKKDKQVNIENRDISFQQNLTLNLKSFGYGKEVILKDIHLNLKKGDKIGILGSSGGGKSTLINILVGLIIEYDGTLEIDGIKLNETNINSWRNQIAYVPQNVFLFDASLKENITFGTSVENNIENILLKVKLDQFVDGRDIDLIEIGERSSKISGGEKQRIALARALYKNNSVLVFDEATNALDKKTEAEIFKIIYELSNITTFIITHDIQNLYGCDRIYELKNETLNQVDII